MQSSFTIFMKRLVCALLCHRLANLMLFRTFQLWKKATFGQMIYKHISEQISTYYYKITKQVYILNRKRRECWSMHLMILNLKRDTHCALMHFPRYFARCRCLTKFPSFIVQVPRLVNHPLSLPTCENQCVDKKRHNLLWSDVCRWYMITDAKYLAGELVWNKMEIAWNIQLI